MFHPLDPTILFGFTLGFLICLILIGDTFITLFQRFGQLFEDLDVFERINMKITIGSIIIIILVLILTLFGFLFTIISAFVFLASFIGIRGVLFIKSKDYKSFLKKLRLIKSDWKMISDWRRYSFEILFSTVIILITVSRLIPLVNLYVPPGDDPKFHALITLLIVENNGIPSTWQPYIDSSLSYMVGFHAICAYFVYLFFTPAHTSVMITTNIYSSLITISTYYFVKRVYKNRRIALSAAFVLGMLTFMPIHFFSWGGNSAILGYYLALTAIGFLYDKFVQQENFDIKYIFIGALLTMGAFYAHYLSSLLLLVFILLPLLYKTFQRRKLWNFLAVFTTCCLGFLLTLPLSIRAFSVANNPLKQQFLNQIYIPYWWNRALFVKIEYFTSFEGLAIIWKNASWIFGDTTILFFGVGLIYILAKSALKQIQKEHWYVLVWLVILGIFSMNDPEGSFFIQFPFWYNFIPDRTFYTATFPISCIAGYGLYRLISDIPRIKPLVSLRRRELPWILSFIIIIIVITPQIVWNVDHAIRFRNFSAVSAEDYSAMIWIQENTDENAIFYAGDFFGADAGQWIPVLAHRKVISPYTNHFEEYVTIEFWNDMQSLNAALLSDPSTQKAIKLLVKYGVDYIYIGAKIIHDRPQLSPYLFHEPYYAMVYQEDNVWIFKFQE
ncbi:MAG: hypothetical protein ACFFCD_08515 [Promethearchaeota archaeon]